MNEKDPTQEPDFVSTVEFEHNPEPQAGAAASSRMSRAQRMQQWRNNAGVGGPAQGSGTFQWRSWLLIPLVFLMGLGSGWLIWGRDARSAIANSQVTVDQNVKRYEVTIDNNPSQGPVDAAVTIVEFSDYQCPYCVRWYQEVYKRLMDTYKGKIRFVYRDFPLYSIHPDAEPAAEAANCAGEQNAYWQYHDALFGQKSGLGSAAYVQYASELGLNMEKFNQCVSEHRFQAEIKADFKYASGLGVSSTPTFFVNGLAVVGAQPFEVFQQIIDKELAGEIPK